MRLIGKLSQHNRGIGSIIGAVFIALILLSGFASYALTLDVTQQYNNTVSSMNDVDWNRIQENIVIKGIVITSGNQLNITLENDGSIQSHLIWLGIFNTTTTPQKQKYQALNQYIVPGMSANLISSFTVMPGINYLVQLVTSLGNTIESSFYPAKSAKCTLTLMAAPPTVYQKNKVTLILAVTPNDTLVNFIQSMTATLNATSVISHSSLTVNGLTRGTSAFFWWICNATTVGTVAFNGTYSQAPSGFYALTSISVLPLPVGITGPTGPPGPPGFSTKATFYSLAQNYPFGGAPTTMKPNDIGASTCLVYPFEIDRNITVTAIYIRSNVATSNCLLIGIYDSTGTRLYVSSVLSTVATGWIAITGISITLPSGTYYFGTTNNNQGVGGGNSAYTVTPSIGTGSATLPRWGSVPTSAGAMPTSITPSSITKTNGGWMCYVLLSAVTS